MGTILGFAKMKSTAGYYRDDSILALAFFSSFWYFFFFFLEASNRNAWPPALRPGMALSSKQGETR
jgi:hypothetical protein